MNSGQSPDRPQSPLDESTRAALERIARDYGTPCYAYFVDAIRARFDRLATLLGGRFGMSYAVKSNPNVELLRRIRDKVVTLDTSSIAEVERGRAAGYDPKDCTFSGPAKRLFELERAVELGVGEMVCESPHEIATLNRLAGDAGRRMEILIRINPNRMPRKFGVAMAGKPSQFGIDEDDVDAILKKRSDWTHLDLVGFHIYSGTNSLDADAISDNFGIFIEIFTRVCHDHDIQPRKLVFGSGFGIPYMPDHVPLDVERVAALVNPQIDAMKRDARLAGATCALEMGRWLVGTNGYCLTSIIGEKLSRGTHVRLCDVGFNNHLGACGMMGTIIRRNWQFWKVGGDQTAPVQPHLLVGPLCTTIDQLATQLEMPALKTGDVLAIGSSGAYGVTASPTRFISHPDPREYLVIGNGQQVEIVDATETELNYPSGATHLPPAGRAHVRSGV
jgi:diaminopimelate decarboxylase